MSDETHEQRDARFQRIRRTKWLLRFTPRRAVLHRYPIIGRFAAVARNRSYLWSFRTEQVRPALYAGSIVAFLPIMGVQLPVAFVLSLLLRCNLMIFAGLQFITNPFTAAPIYYGTYQLGQAVIRNSGFGHSVELVEETHLPAGPPVEIAPEEPTIEPLPDMPDAPVRPGWTQRFGTAINALVLGGVIAGTVAGLVLDLLWQWSTRGRRLKSRPPRSGSTERRTPPM